MINPKRSDDRRDRSEDRWYPKPLTKPRGQIKTVTQAMVPRRSAPPLAVAEAELLTLDACERLMVRGFQDVARAWATIREGRLYKEVGCETFDAYCERMGLSRRRGDQLADAHFTIKSLPKQLRTIVLNEAKARAISTISEEKRVEVLTEAKRTGNTTARAIRELAAGPVIDVEPEPAAEPILDVTPAVKHCPTCTCGD